MGSEAVVSEYLNGPPPLNIFMRPPFDLAALAAKFPHLRPAPTRAKLQYRLILQPPSAPEETHQQWDQARAWCEAHIPAGDWNWGTDKWTDEIVFEFADLDIAFLFKLSFG
ncbi:hypothetical protein [Alsobacter sp. SYSU BS001988]